MATDLDPTTLKTPPMGSQEEKIAPPPPPGRYVGTVGNFFRFEEDEGYMRPVIKINLEGVPDGCDPGIFDRISAKPRTRGKRVGTTRLGDYLLTCGVPPMSSEDPSDWAEAVRATEGASVDVTIGWDCYDSTSSTSLADNYDAFPDDPDNPGEKLPYCQTEDGRKVMGRARIYFYNRPR